MRYLRTLCTSLLIALCTCAASAHGIPKPKHGGVVDVGGEISFEMVVTPSTMTFFLEDHGKPIPTQGAVGELLLGSETGKKIGALRGNSGNSMTGKLATFKPGSRLFIRVVLGDGSTVVGELVAP